MDILNHILFLCLVYCNFFFDKPCVLLQSIFVIENTDSCTLLVNGEFSVLLLWLLQMSAVLQVGHFSYVYLINSGLYILEGD